MSEATQPTAIIFDLDGTLADVRHRLTYVRRKPPDWGAFFRAGVEDSVHETTATMLRELYALRRSADSRFHEATLFICSARPEDYRADTVAWLKHNDLPHDVLLMRASGDHRPDVRVKREMLKAIRGQGYHVLFAIDDRPSVVRMWRENDVPCFAVDDREWERAQSPPGADFEGQTLLSLTIGPSGSGKSTWLARAYGSREAERFLSGVVADEGLTPSTFGIFVSHIISSDQLREDILGSWKDQTRNDAVFRAMHELTRTRLSNGLPVVLDATHVRRSERLLAANLAPTGTRVRYLVFDRPLAVKLRDPRTPPRVIRNQHHIFQSQLRDILSGDHLPQVDVVDLREQPE